MEIETLFATSKWILLKILSEGPRSPIELATLSKTSLANVSQQLRLLELGGIVVKKRVSNRDKGLPRILYDLNQSYAFIIVSSTGFSDKKSISLTPMQKASLKIWMTFPKENQFFVEKALWNLSSEFDKIKAVQYNPGSLIDIELKIITENNELKKTIKDFVITNNNVSRKIHFSFAKEESPDCITLFSENHVKENKIYGEVSK